jgi:hypothetical protein
MAAEHPIDLALDIHMPGEGPQSARHLRERYATIAIVMLTGTVVDRSWPQMVPTTMFPSLDPARVAGRVKSIRGFRRPPGADIGAEQVSAMRARRLRTGSMRRVRKWMFLEFDLLKALAEHPNRPLSRTFSISAGKIGTIRPQRGPARYATA